MIIYNENDNYDEKLLFIYSFISNLDMNKM